MKLAATCRRSLALLVLTLCTARAVFASPVVPDMILIPAGELSMGSEKGAGDEKPRRSVRLSAYYIAQTEVTNAQYLKYWLSDGAEESARTPISYDHVGAWPGIAGDRPEDPVVGVTWEDAAACARWMGCRLPTEAEWERAACGDDTRAYPWGDAFMTSTRSADAHANVRGNEDGHKGPAPVGVYLSGASPFGVLDMAGNVAEWVADKYSATYYRRAPDVDPPGPEAGFYRVIRGGSWMHDALDARTARRLFEPPGMGLSYVGFRVARDE